jgi:riboflavin kinase / FMN adenylyltransferase
VRTLTDIARLEVVPGPVFLAVGVFDGMHLGHRAVLGRALADSRARGGSAVAATFDPHPARTLRPDRAPHLLTSMPHKAQMIASMGFAWMLVMRFDSAFAETPPEVFLESLHASCRPLAEIVVGHGWMFGSGRRGSVGMIREAGARMGFDAVEIPPVAAGGEQVSSTRIRRAIASGDLATAALCLGRPYTILGTVVRGRGLGSRLGFPTANLSAHNEQFPPDGVYAVHACLPGSPPMPGVANIGVRPTLESSGARTLEVHLTNFDRDIYGQDLEVTFLRFLRPERKFAGTGELREQISRDLAEARAVHAARQDCIQGPADPSCGQ